MRKIVIMGTVVAMMLALFVPAALAATFTCTHLPCYGTNNNDTINERPAAGTPDDIYGLKRGDYINAGISFDDRDIVHGNRGNDRLLTNDGDPDDAVIGGPGYDRCYVDPGDAYRGCEEVFD